MSRDLRVKYLSEKSASKINALIYELSRHNFLPKSLLEKKVRRFDTQVSYVRVTTRLVVEQISVQRA